jgi:hypothetical protein
MKIGSIPTNGESLDEYFSGRKRRCEAIQVSNTYQIMSLTPESLPGGVETEMREPGQRGYPVVNVCSPTASNILATPRGNEHGAALARSGASGMSPLP